MEREFFPLLLERGVPLLRLRLAGLLGRHRHAGEVLPGAAGPAWRAASAPTWRRSGARGPRAGSTRPRPSPHGADPRARGDRRRVPDRGGRRGGPERRPRRRLPASAPGRSSTRRCCGRRSRSGRPRGSRGVSSGGACRSAPTPASRPAPSWATARASATIPASPGTPGAAPVPAIRFGTDGWRASSRTTSPRRTPRPSSRPPPPRGRRRRAAVAARSWWATTPASTPGRSRISPRTSSRRTAGVCSWPTGRCRRPSFPTAWSRAGRPAASS